MGFMAFTEPNIIQAIKEDIDKDVLLHTPNATVESIITKVVDDRWGAGWTKVEIVHQEITFVHKWLVESMVVLFLYNIAVQKAVYIGVDVCGNPFVPTDILEITDVYEVDGTPKLTTHYTKREAGVIVHER